MVTFILIVLVIGLKWFFNEQKTTKRITKVFNNIVEETMLDLQLQQRPTLKFDACNGSFMYVTKTTNYKQMNFIMQREITDVSTDYVIHVNSPAIAKAITELNKYTLRDLSTEYIKALLRHEMRHLYQIEQGWGVGTIEHVIQFDTTFLDGYGNSPEESDANLYAISAAQNEHEYWVANFHKSTQDLAGKILPNYKEVRKALLHLHRFGKFMQKAR